MNEREKNTLFQNLMDTEKELPSDLKETLGETKYKQVHSDRLLDKKLTETIRYQASSRLSDAEFKNNLMKALDAAGEAKKPSSDIARHVLVYLREKFLYSESASMQWSGAAAALLVVSVIPYILTGNLNYHYSEINTESSIPVISSEKDDFPNSSRMEEMDRRDEPSLAPVPAAAESVSGVRTRSFNMEMSEEDVIPEDSALSGELSSSEKKADRSTSAASNTEQSLLKALEDAKTDQEKLAALKQLEKFYLSDGQSEKLRTTREKISIINNSKP